MLIKYLYMMNGSAEIKIYPSPDEVMEKAAKHIVTLINKNDEGKFHIALAGGETPKKLYQILNRKYGESISLSKVHFWWGDERCVPPSHQESNFRMVNENLFNGLNINTENIHRIKGENDPEKEAKRYAGEIDSVIEKEGTVPAFDIIILGLGGDGHTASIFPDRTDLLNHDPLCAVVTHPSTGQTRITLTGKILNEAKNLFYIVTGANKSNPVASIMNNDDSASQLPAYHISSRYGNTIWFLDDAASAGIE